MRHHQTVLTVLSGDCNVDSHCYRKERYHGSTLVLGNCMYRKQRLGFWQMQAEEESL